MSVDKGRAMVVERDEDAVEKKRRQVAAADKKKAIAANKARKLAEKRKRQGSVNYALRGCHVSPCPKSLLPLGGANRQVSRIV